jgi:hypothetical protein
MERGETLANGFTVNEAREGRYELVRALPGGGRVSFTASSEAQVVAQASEWLADQLRRKDGGVLAVAPTSSRVKR